MSYGYVYVAQVAMSNPQQVVKAMLEAEAYKILLADRSV